MHGRRLHMCQLLASSRFRVYATRSVQQCIYKPAVSLTSTSVSASRTFTSFWWPIRSKALRRLDQKRISSCTQKFAIQPRTFPTDGFPLLPAEERFEEERLLGYNADQYYPVHLGEIFQSRYQVVAKLGFGVYSTVWLCRGLQDNVLVTLKVCVSSGPKSQELAISHHLKNVEDSDGHPGKLYLRVALDDFHVRGPHASHQCNVFPVLGKTLAEVRDLFKGRAFHVSLLQRYMMAIVHAIDVMHQEGIVHTDLSPSNILLEADDAVVAKVEQAELDEPSPRKLLPDRTIHLSYAMPMTYGQAVITDFGAARLGEEGQKHTGNVMPGIFRAPEIIAEMDWDSSIDIWSVALLTLETCEIRLKGKDRVLLLALMRKLLRWLPEERPSVQDLFEDEFLLRYDVSEKDPEYDGLRKST